MFLEFILPFFQGINRRLYPTKANKEELIKN